MWSGNDGGYARRVVDTIGGAERSIISLLELRQNKRASGRDKDQGLKQLPDARECSSEASMNFLIALPAVLSLLVLGAHFLRSGWTAVAVACAAAPLLLLVRRGWAVKVVQAVLVLGALLWVRTIIVLIDDRQAAGRPWTRMAIILGSVSLFTFLAAVLLIFFRTRGPAVATDHGDPAKTL